MSTQQDIYAAGSENRPPMLNKENYVPWASRLLRYAKSRPNGKLIYNSIMNGPYVRRIIPEPGDANREVPTILLGLPEYIYAAVDSCETAQEIWLRVQQMMKGSYIGIQEKKAKLFNEWEMFTSTDGESIESYYHQSFLVIFKHRLSTQEQYTDLLEPIPEPHQVQQNDSNVISDAPSVEQNGGTVEQSPATVEETRALYDSLYNNLAIEVDKVNSVNRKMKETNAELTTELARYKNQEKINALHLSSDKQITTLNEEISNLNKQLSKEKSIVSSLLEENKRLKSDFKICEDELLDKQIHLENKIKELDNILIKRLQAQLGDLNGKSKDTLCASNTLDPLSQKLEKENVELEFQVVNYVREIEHLKETSKNLFDSIFVTRTQTKSIIDSLQDKLHDTVYENAKLRAQLFDKASEQKDKNKGTSVNTKFANQSILRKLFLQPIRNNFVLRQPNAFIYERSKISNNRVPQKVDKTNDLSKPVTSNSVPLTNESNVMKNDNVIALGVFRIFHHKAYREDKFVPINKVRASVRTNPITVSQPHVITKKDVNSNSNGLSSTGVDHTDKTRSHSLGAIQRMIGSLLRLRVGALRIMRWK
ncbi:hypothetical protein Tco_0975466 [Tanacetum coccineum]|uniref:Uncharacterized protein n=1 Tax=Tanacetum coccineum TaxID=301880 RepID=A0ABQ5EEH9_9ASTR